MISIKTKDEIEIIAEGGKILARIMKELKKRVRPGSATKELDKVAEDLVLKYGAECSFKNYNVPDDSEQKEPYPTCLCTSINDEIVHAVPSGRVLKEGDIISLDLGIQWKGFHTDMAVTLPVLDPSAGRTRVGRINKETQKLIKTTEESLKKGIKEIKPGNYIGDISFAIQKYVESQAYSAREANGSIRGFNVVQELCGHGIGKELHEDPEILNYGEKGTGEQIKEGMVFCLEPMVTTGKGKIKKSKDGHGWQTADGSLSCHFEHTIVVTKDGYRILTKI